MPKKTTLTQVIEACENQLGWVSPFADEFPVWKYRSIEVSRLRKAIDKMENPSRFTPMNLMLAIELLRRKHETVRSPVGLLYKVDEALERANTPTIAVELVDAIENAVAHEQTLQRPDTDMWVRRLSRARGVHRTDVLAEWRDAGRHQN